MPAQRRGQDKVVLTNSYESLSVTLILWQSTLPHHVPLSKAWPTQEEL